jgi:prevent-host-death family protein
MNAPTQRINAHAARQGLAELMDRAHAGEQFVLTKYGEPWAQLLPLHRQAQTPQRQPGRLRQLGPLQDPRILFRR